jgi:hypothetical protein
MGKITFKPCDIQWLMLNSYVSNNTPSYKMKIKMKKVPGFERGFQYSQSTIATTKLIDQTVIEVQIDVYVMTRDGLHTY